MKRTAALLAALLLVLSLSACGADGALKGIGDKFSGWLSAEEETEAPAEGTEEPKREVSNDINVGIVDFETYDPLTTASATVRDVCGVLFEPRLSLF